MSPRLGQRTAPLWWATAVLAACRDDIITLWEDPVVRAILKRRDVAAFLNNAARIANMNYEPADGASPSLSS
ncbi:uncharacterized protein C8Q71DRAFT_863810 [Rhodofomes roseus]|uniref:Uncharacterized protein n=1 Tax=Rhodofomes roseus TaxID=34475 RepID=A0ABQ8JX91_9APHY|nr:uncharacterized protein C8Q71DRAFT_863810 [Rhodofomes roseus]KAH9828694.1 hypothetical protein C8Q71DRAFT_863810 [Rhodofomes roseus]